MSDPIRWRVVRGYPDYEVSDAGQVRSLMFRNGTAYCHRKEPLMLKQHGRRSGGYWAVQLSDGRKKLTRYVHHLVLEAFYGPRPADFVAGHLNGDGHDNRAVNLRWVTPRENEAHKIQHGTKPWGERSGHNVLTLTQVREIRTLSAAGTRNVALAARFGVTRAQISRVLLRQNWRYDDAALAAAENHGSTRTR